MITCLTPDLRRFLLIVAGLLVSGVGCFRAAGAGSPAFVRHEDGGFVFDTGELTGRLRAAGGSFGLQQVVHRPTKLALDHGNGLLGHYRVFANGQRFGGGAWDWPSTAELRDDGSVHVIWPADSGRPFALEAVYRWIDPATVELETTVRAESAVRGFESFIACYFDQAFTNALVCASSTSAAEGEKPGFVRVTEADGAWQMFPRDDAAVRLIEDGRWQLPPHPVAWVVRSPWVLPIARRRAPLSGLSAILMAEPAECFALATPHETEGHYSTYCSLFGRDLAAGESARARVRLAIVVAKSPAAVVAMYQEAAKAWAAASKSE